MLDKIIFHANIVPLRADLWLRLSWSLPTLSSCFDETKVKFPVKRWRSDCRENEDELISPPLQSVCLFSISGQAN